MRHIFISYAHNDLAFARLISLQLRMEGFPVWQDESNLLPGDQWWPNIEEAIRNAAAFVIIMSSSAHASQWVQRELLLVESLPGKPPVLPILLEGSIWSRLADIQVESVPDPAKPQLSQVFIRKLSSYFPDLLTGGRSEVSQTELTDVLTKTYAQIVGSPADWCTLDAGHKMIAKYPITNRQWREFENADDGRRNQRWWEFSPYALQWRLENPTPRSMVFDEDTLPHTEICWYEAMAFCEWVSVRVQAALASTTRYVFRLPTEDEWNRAAYGDSDRSFTWDGPFDSSRCNTQEHGIGHPTPVTMFETGISVVGALDMVGNVWEWTLTEEKTGQHPSGGNAARILRGGSWRTNQFMARSGYRLQRYPLAYSDDIGFRILCVRENVGGKP